MAAARCPAETPAWITATNAHHPHLPVSEARKGRGEGQRVLSRLADTVVTRPEEGGVRVVEESGESEYWSSGERESGERQSGERESGERRC